MEFLKEQFESELVAEIDDEGRVLIGGAEFFPSEVLRALDEQSYLSSFEDWLADQKQRRTSRAEAILDLHGNRDRFSSLKAAFDRNHVLPFVGAGLSQSSGYPGWTAFLGRMRLETRVTEEEFQEMIDGGFYESAAQSLYDDMPAGAFNEELENVFCIGRGVSGPVQFLPHMFKGPVVTTNFDDVLKFCYDRTVPFSETLLGGEAPEIRRHLSRGEHVLIKLHGKGNSARKRILTSSEYDNFYGDAESLPNVIKAIATNQLLFIGCSLSVDRTIKVLSELADEQGHDNAVRHYAFLPLFDPSKRLERRDELAASNIFPIWYPVEESDSDEIHDESIAALLEALGIEG